MAPRDHRATHPGVAEVRFQEGDYMSSLLASKPFKKGDKISDIEGTFAGPKKYTSVQKGKDDHFELNSDLVFMNHSCDPNVQMNVADMAVYAARDIAKGEGLTFFYPSTEWDMDQVSGAKYIKAAELKQHGFVNKHIIELKQTAGH